MVLEWQPFPENVKSEFFLNVLELILILSDEEMKKLSQKNLDNAVIKSIPSVLVMTE